MVLSWSFGYIFCSEAGKNKKNKIKRTFNYLEIVFLMREKRNKSVCACGCMCVCLFQISSILILKVEILSVEILSHRDFVRRDFVLRDFDRARVFRSPISNSAIFCIVHHVAALNLMRCSLS